jgi:hypothetical protein
MLTRRGFAAVASCAICGITDFVATEVSAEGAPPLTSSKAPSNFPYKVSRPARSKEAMPSRYRPRRPMQVVSLSTPRASF